MFGKKKKSNEEAPIKKKIAFKTYPAKIVLAWIKSLEGNADITQWLLQNDYKELVITNQAIYLKKEARNWLMENGFPHLLAFVNAMEGQANALNWLRNYGLLDYYFMALAIDGEMEGWNWLQSNEQKELFLLCRTIKNIKDAIEDDHNDIHHFGKD